MLVLGLFDPLLPIFEYELIFTDAEYYIFENPTNSMRIKVSDFFIPALIRNPALSFI